MIENRGSEQSDQAERPGPHGCGAEICLALGSFPGYFAGIGFAVVIVGKRRRGLSCRFVSLPGWFCVASL